MRVCILWAILVALLYAGPLARAQVADKPEIPWLAVMVLPGTDLSPTDRLPVQSALISRALSYSGEGLAWQLMAFSPLESPRQEGEVLLEVSRLAEEGKKSYRYLKLDEARKVFSAAGELLESSPPAHCDPGMMSKMYFYWARAALDDGDESGAQSLLTQIGRFDSEAGPDPAVMPPNLVATYDIALEDLRRKPEAKILLEITPGNGDLFVNCVAKPAGVVQIKGHVGEKFWLVAKIEDGTYRGSFTFTDGPRRTLKIFGGRVGDAARIADHLLGLGRSKPTIGLLKSSANDDLGAISEILHVNVFLVAEVKANAEGSKALRLGLYVPDKGIIGPVHNVPLDEKGHPNGAELSTALEVLARSMRSPSMIAALSVKSKPQADQIIATAVAQPPRKDEISERTPWYQSWWFWTAAGVLVAGAVTTGVILGTTGSGTSPSGQVILTVSPP
ncbi:MAG TPA: hypothetical protein VM425_19030 [Myxococcota bacterium]|nr:hypothetical protein [Myxococcota bacterium]